MKVLRLITVVLFIVILGVFIGFNIYNDATADDTVPQIELPAEPMEISISAAESDLLADVKAYDAKDGDLTDEIVVESISSFIDDGVCQVTYAVSDSDCHVAKAKRLIRYVDYTPPKLYLRLPLVFPVGEKVDFRDIVGAVDCIDGDISDMITFVATDYTSTTAGVYSLSVQVTSKRGDTIRHEFPVYVEQNSKLAPTITLTENLIYVKKGDTPDFDSYVLDVKSGERVLEDVIPVYSTKFDSSTAGMYSVDYYATGGDGNVGHTVLTVVVEEN